MLIAGSNNTKIQNLGHSKLALHSRGKDWARNDAERLCRKLVIDGILKEDLQITAQDHAVCYVRLGPRAVDLMQNKLKASPFDTSLSKSVSFENNCFVLT